MDPVTLIAAALAAGALGGTKEAASAAVRDAYTGLRDLVRRRTADSADAQAVLDEQDAGAAPGQDRLAAVLAEAGVGGDAEVVAAAMRLMTLLDPEGAGRSKYVVHMPGAKGVIVGDHGTVHIQS